MPQQSSIWKKEISFGRRRRQPTPLPAPAPIAPAPPPPAAAEDNGAVVHETDARVVAAKDVVARCAVITRLSCEVGKCANKSWHRRLADVEICRIETKLNLRSIRLLSLRSLSMQRATAWARTPMPRIPRLRFEAE